MRIDDVRAKQCFPFSGGDRYRVNPSVTKMSRSRYLLNHFTPAFGRKVLQSCNDTVLEAVLKAGKVTRGGEKVLLSSDKQFNIL